MSRRNLLAAIGLFLLAGAAVQAQQSGRPSARSASETWAVKMFDQLNHDFGAVPRGADARRVFTIINPYQETIHIAGLTKTCGCTAARVDKTTIAPGDRAHVQVQLDSRRFIGRKNSSVTVTFDQPFYSEVRLRFTSYIRRDVVVEPGSVNFGTLQRGTDAEKEVSIAYAGRSNWRIERIETDSPFLDSQLAETSREGQRINYRLTVRMKPGAAPGYLFDQIRIITNDRKLSSLPVIVKAKIESALSVNPSALSLGVVRPGETVTRPVVIRAKEPFRVKDVTRLDGEMESFSVKLPVEARKLQVIPITFKAGSQQGRRSCKFRIETDLPEDSVVEFSAYAQVRDQDQG